MLFKILYNCSCGNPIIFDNCSIVPPKSAAIDNIDNFSLTDMNDSSTSSEKDFFNIYKDEKYVVGKRIFDLDYVNLDLIKESFSLDEFPGIVFDYNLENSSFYVEIDSGNIIKFNYSLYIADINNDGYYELCYSYTEGSGNLSFYTEIFDYHNKELLFSSKDSSISNCIFDVTENYILILEEIIRVTGTKYELKKTSRFTKHSESQVTLESFDIEAVFKGISCSFSPVGENVKKDETLRIDITIHMAAKNIDNCPVQEKDFNVLCTDNKFTYSVKSRESTASYLPDFSLNLSFSQAGEKQITVKVGEFICKGLVKVFN